MKYILIILIVFFLISRYRIKIMNMLLSLIQVFIIHINDITYFNILSRAARPILKFFVTKKSFKFIYPNIELIYDKNISSPNSLEPKQSIVIVNGGAFIANDSFDLYICDAMQLKFPNHQIISIHTLKNVSFDLIIDQFKKDWSELINNKITITHVFAHSAGASIILSLSKYYRLPKLILISPFIVWNISKITTDMITLDFIKPQMILRIIKDFNFNIKNYFNPLNINSIKIFVGSNEVLLADVQYFCIDNNIKDLTILPNNPHGLITWLVYNNFDINIIFNNLT